MPQDAYFVGYIGGYFKKRKCLTLAFKTRIYYISLKKQGRNLIIARSRMIPLAYVISIALQL